MMRAPGFGADPVDGSAVHTRNGGGTATLVGPSLRRVPVARLHADARNTRSPLVQRTIVFIPGTPPRRLSCTRRLSLVSPHDTADHAMNFTDHKVVVALIFSFVAKASCQTNGGEVCTNAFTSPNGLTQSSSADKHGRIGSRSREGQSLHGVGDSASLCSMASLWRACTGDHLEQFDCNSYEMQSFVV